jgi:NADH-dependent peroxiredoxin subunit C
MCGACDSVCDDEECCCDSEMTGFGPARIGARVPSMELSAYDPKKDDLVKIDTAELLGKWVIYFFYPADFTFVCPTELEEMAGLYAEFQKEGAEVLSVSTDTAFAHKAWHDTSDAIKKIQYPMVADPDGSLSMLFGTYIEEGDDAGLSLRGTFIVDPKGVLKTIEIHDNAIGRSGKELLRKLRAAKFVAEHGGNVCPASWEPGDDTLKPGIGLVGKI